jgi:hypothetical protein
MASFYLIIKAFETYEDIAWGSFSSIGSFKLQINPSSVSCTFRENELDDEPASANGGAIPQKSPTYFKESISFAFTLDLTGVIPNVPDGDLYRMLYPEESYLIGLDNSIEKLKGVTIYPLRSTHAPPFVHLVWGDISLKGVVTNLGIEYTYFNSMGRAVRAEISITINEFINRDVEESKYQSPDITRIPTIKSGDTLPALCKEFYSNKKYYVKIAEINGLPSFRRLKLGEKLLFPPLEK